MHKWALQSEGSGYRGRDCKLHSAHISGSNLIFVKGNDQKAFFIKVEALIAGKLLKVILRHVAVVKIAYRIVGCHLGSHLFFNIGCDGGEHFRPFLKSSFRESCFPVVLSMVKIFVDCAPLAMTMVVSMRRHR